MIDSPRLPHRARRSHNVTGRVPVGIRLLCCTSLLVAGCTQHAADAADAIPRPTTTDSSVSFTPTSPSLKELLIDSVMVRRSRAVATLPAQIVFDENHTTRVQSPVIGRITQLLAQPGDRVRVGTPLAQIASADAAQATSDAAKADAALVLSEAALARVQDLYAHRVVALKDVEQARADAAQARAEQARARARISQLGRVDGAGHDFTLRAPVGGMIVERPVEPGTEVRPDNGSALFTISALDRLWLTATANQRDVTSARRGDRLIFVTEAVPGRQFEATIEYVASALDPATRTLQLRASIDNNAGLLKPQMFGEARLMASDVSGALIVPSGALMTTAAGQVLFVETAPGRFIRRVVIASSDDGTEAVLTRGVHAGERIVVRGGLFLAAEQAKAR